MKTLIVTGATGAIGWEATKELVRSGFCVIMAVRNVGKATALKSQLPHFCQSHVVIRQLDISLSESVRRFINETDVPIWGLLNNAGTLQRHYHTNPDGCELTYATNFLGTAQLTLGMLPQIVSQGVVVNTTSLACYVSHSRALGILNPRNSENYSQIGAYADSKMALTLFSQELARQTQGRLRVNCTDPGIVDTALLKMDRWYDPLTNLLFRPFCKSPQAGALPAVRALLSHDSGKLFRGKDTILDMPPRFDNPTMARELYTAASHIALHLGKAQ